MLYRENKIKEIINNPENRQYELSAQAKPEMLELFLNEIQIFKKKRILDLYCETGLYSIELASMGYEVIVADPFEEVMSFIAEKAQRLELNLTKTKMLNPYKTNLPERIVNGVIIIDIIDYFNHEQVEYLINEIYRVLVPNSYTLINFLPENPLPTRFDFLFKQDGTLIMKEGPEKGKIVYLRSDEMIDNFFKDKFFIIDKHISKSGRRKILAKKV